MTERTSSEGWGSEWDDVADVVVVGSGAAGYAAALTAAHSGASVIVLERGSLPGGTTAKSGGGFWIPNNVAMRKAGLADPRQECLEYMARLAYPALYDPTDPTLGLASHDYALLEAFYDNGSEAIDFLRDIGAIYVDLESVRPHYPDYHADLPENRAPYGRSLGPSIPPGMEMPPELFEGRGLLIGGAVMIETMRRKGEELGVRLLLDHRVVHAHRNAEGEVVGVEARTGHRTLLVGARRGVVFASGGFLLNPEKARAFLRGPVFGGCAADTNTGDFVDIGIELGASLGNMTHAWWTQCVLELALRAPSTAEDIWFPFGDSMIQVNKYGERVVNEKMTYNDRPQIHFLWDAGRREYSNLLLFQIWDDVVAQNDLVTPFRGLVPMPGDDVDYVIQADTFAELAERLDARLESLAHHTGGFRLDESFVANLLATVERFNRYAEQGRDEEFARGETPIQVAWQGPAREGVANPCLAPFAEDGPYYCMILGAGALDTKGGPRVDTNARVLGVDGEPIPGLYGAGNCIASPMAQSYPGAGGTIGPALTFGYLAGRHVAGLSPHQPD